MALVASLDVNLNGQAATTFAPRRGGVTVAQDFHSRAQQDAVV